ncbi:TPA: hypothetical protein P7L42_003373 [Vibrio cholerae]|uniref:Uncharacterized protein n=1 Tax=Vibrio cholerae TaxID=666 RepID=A0A7Z7VNZ8_VIBCL|nr:hypothetical protein [Vibrio cholerae]EGR0592935.1 hypothetical protein [Vibrio cholerae]EJL6307271.1 hypothetical protein [Vibrio cholerae]EJL6311025.1 hypothetical protein [Vibrio cholerae]EJL6419628.1 hypothetical protein [Vibrio cholerae]EJL6582256.1 hypothetical protein [Vibrio cholerae]
MAAVKKSVRLVDNTVDACRVISKASGNDTVNWSGSLNAMADEYTLIMQENKPELTQEQWNALYSVYNGYMPSEDAQREARLLSWHVSEGYQYDQTVRELLGTEQDAVRFIEEIKSWTLTKQLSAIYHAKKFWC